MDVNEWMSYESSDEGTCTQNINSSSTRSHASEEQNRSTKAELFPTLKHQLKCIKFIQLLTID
jgi:hypothetical protein